MNIIKKVLVIGAGLGGLSASARLASRGFDVDVYEQRAGPGGKASEIEVGGYRWDTGPSLLTLPSVFEQFFREVGSDISHHLEFVRLDPITRYFYPDGTVIDAFSDKERFAEEIENKTEDTAENVLSYLEYCRRIYDLTSGMFMYKSLGEISTYFSRDAFRTLARIREIDALRSMHRANSERFKDPRVVQLFDRYATYNGSSPYLAPATFNLIQNVEYGLGGYGVKGGIYSISREMTRVAEEHGVSFHFDEEVHHIMVDGGKVKGIATDKGKRYADVVISNSDVANTYRKLMKDRTTRSKKRYSQLEPSSSGCVFYWGIPHNNEELLVNNILFSGDYEKEFKDIWTYERPPLDPTVYINITSRIDVTDAPDEGENWFVLVNVPYDSGQDWDREMRGLRERTISRIERTLGREIDISAEEVLDPRDIEGRWSGNRGSIYGISSNDRRSAFRRQGNRSRSVKGLYFCGGSAHPGGGMPLVVLSGKITSDLVERYE